MSPLIVDTPRGHLLRRRKPFVVARRISKKNGAKLVVYTCEDTANQRWTLP
jgi:hypothetical protein